MFLMARQAIAEELKNEANNARLWLEHGRLSMLLDDKATAMESLRKAASIDPNILQDINGEFNNR